MLLSLTRFCEKKSITTGTLQVIGAVRNARVGYYDQAKKKYRAPAAFNRGMEILSCFGNISLKEGEVFLHAHITLADSRGRAFGGHLLPGTRVFAAEFIVREYAGKTLVRKQDLATGLSLWG